MSEKGNLNKYYGHKRGLVVSNEDYYVSDNDKLKDENFIFGRIKVYVEGVYPVEFAKAPEMLPWAEPVMPLFGGNGSTEAQRKFDEVDNSSHFAITKNYTNTSTGVNTVPHVGSYVWVFFEDGNPMYPFYFGAVQAGNNWMAEHTNQHIIATDNVLIKIDENQAHVKSTMKFNSNNSESTVAGRLAGNRKLDMPTLVDIEITNKKPEKAVNRSTKESDKDIYKHKTDKDFCAVNLIIQGNVNLYVNGNMYEQIEGDRFITHNGNLYYKHNGDTEIEENGAIVRTHIGDLDELHNGDKYLRTTGNVDETIQGFDSKVVFEDHHLNVGGSEIRNANLQIKDTSQIIKHEKGEADTTYNIDPYQISESYYDMLRNPLDYTEIDEDGVY